MLQTLKDVDFGEGIDLVVGLTATALAADQLLRLKDSKQHKKMHLAKAGLSAAAAAAAFTMLQREHNERHQNNSSRHHGHHSDYSADSDRQNDRLRSRSTSPRSSLRDYRPQNGHGHDHSHYASVPSRGKETYSSYHRHPPYHFDVEGLPPTPTESLSSGGPRYLEEPHAPPFHPTSYHHGPGDGSRRSAKPESTR